MKKLGLFSVVALCVLSFLSVSAIKDEKMSEKQKEQIKKEVITVFDSIMRKFERSDLNGMFEYYSPNFVCYGLDGKKYTIQQVKDEYTQQINAFVSYKWTTYNFDFIVITKNIVVVSIDGKNEAALKSDRKYIFDPSHYSYAFEKVDGKWKLCYHHFSGTFVR